MLAQAILGEGGRSSPGKRSHSPDRKAAGARRPVSGSGGGKGRRPPEPTHGGCLTGKSLPGRLKQAQNHHVEVAFRSFLEPRNRRRQRLSTKTRRESGNQGAKCGFDQGDFLNPDSVRHCKRKIHPRRSRTEYANHKAGSCLQMFPESERAVLPAGFPCPGRFRIKDCRFNVDQLARLCPCHFCLNCYS